METVVEATTSWGCSREEEISSVSHLTNGESRVPEVTMNVFNREGPASASISKVDKKPLKKLDILGRQVEGARDCSFDAEGALGVGG